ncbi:peptidase domain-containing ABC transporter [Alteromonadaceae bacterium M269]|nr:peptidase domain-containing ABC transporter [Alteromonadaceae bacterium M269]
MINPIKLTSKRSLPIIRQSEATECGLACIAMIAGYYGRETDLNSLRRKFSVSMQGTTLRSMMDIAAKLDFTTRAIRVPLPRVDQVRLPAVIHWDLDHYVVLKSVKKNKIVILDPAIGECIYTRDEFSDHFTGVALELEPTSNFKKAKDAVKLRLVDLLGNIFGLKRNLIQVLILSAILQAFLLASPFYLQIAIDEVLPTFDHDLLLVLALGFGGFTIINVIAQTVRGYILVYLGSMLTFQMEGNLFRHLLRLPADFFEKRHLGDLVSRFASMRPIEEALSEGVIAGILDGVMALTTLILMYVYSPMLASISFGAWLLFFSIRMATYKHYRASNERDIVTNAKAQSLFMESARGIISLKLFGGEDERERFWRNKNADSINKRAYVQKLLVWYSTLNSSLFGIENIIVIYLLITFALGGSGFTVGMIFAYMAYRRNFLANANDLVDRAVQFRSLGVHLDRIADIALTDTEIGTDNSHSAVLRSPVEGQIELRDVTYSYGSDTEDVLKGINLSINVGESIAIVGASGCGKTTLLKVMMGLLQAKGGQVLVDDMPLQQYGISSFRRQVGAVMQEDNLFAGSIAENIAFFDTHADMQKIIEAAKSAMIHDEIMAMAMNYETLVGDMGSSLSGGQQQRVMLARAIYRQPSILFMDEGTAHLDVATEQNVNRSIQSLGITRVVIAHRPETIRMADRIIKMDKGKLVEVELDSELKPHDSKADIEVIGIENTTSQNEKKPSKTSGINAPAF